jgi:predicted glycoside hydrolase/deacetylase ChbG (UPF0249 family)
MEHPRRRKICIVNGDDFGASAGVNHGILEAHTAGILTSTSLMINMPGSREAIELSASHPDLSVGLHVNFTNEGDHLIDLGDPGAAREELENQFERFVHAMGRMPTHLDAHHNVHRLPSLLPLFREFAAERDILLREHSPVRYFSGFYGRWDGESHPEHISPRQLMDVLATEIRPGFTELACHPGSPGDFESEYALERGIELASLCDERVREQVAELAIELMNYRQVRELLDAGEGHAI